MKKNFFTPGVVLIIVLIVAIVIFGFIFWSLQSNAPAGNNSSTLSEATSTGVTASPSSTANPTSTAWQTYKSSKVHVSFSFPPDWALGPNTPISLDNFNHQYQSGSIIPAGGAEIDITNTGLVGTSLAEIIATETMGDAVSTTKSISVDGVSCTEVLYEGSYAQGHPSDNSAVYCPDSANNLLYKLYLSHPTDDAKGAQAQEVFAQVLNSVRFQ